MEIPKPLALGILAIVVALALAIGWFFTMGGKGRSTVQETAYPKSQQGGAGVEAYGVPPPSPSEGHEELPLADQLKR